ncbi:polysaccharide biosynthesis/export family protein [Pedobacter immunditicola]|uniref:polysaccharide biosynthesis/export family protein n=1 Tax=Pedobacter immunditicola TaxID=3133440 RepID=UPI00309F2FA5
MKRNYIYYALCIILLSGCAKRNLVYFSDLTSKNEITTKIMNDGVPKIIENDILSITVNSTSPESNVLFASTTNNIGANGLYEREGYRVNSDGKIKFPVLGEIKVEGLNIVQAQSLIESELSKYVNNSVVNVKFLNFRVTVIGEVNTPSTFVVPNEKINLLEALGLAGDMTPYGKRENVLIIREVDGKRTMARVNLNKQNVLNSPYFYLKQNDVIYIEPDKTKSIEYSNSSNTMPLVVAAISAVAVLATALLQ